MSTEAEVAMLMLRLLIDKPKELQKVMDYLQREVLLHKAVLEVGNAEVATRTEIMKEFRDKYGLEISFLDDEAEDDPAAPRPVRTLDRVIGLPGGAMYKVE